MEPYKTWSTSPVVAPDATVCTHIPPVLRIRIRIQEVKKPKNVQVHEVNTELEDQK